MVSGITRACPDCETILLPMADGGEGTVDALVYSTGGRTLTTEVTGPLGDRVAASWGILGDGTTGVVEMAAASGLALVHPDKMDPLAATTFGTGELVLAALDAGCRHLIIGIGGSATNDGGAGMAQALGARLTDQDGQALEPGGAALARLVRIDTSGMDSRLADCTVTVASDVTNPLCGEQGASWIYGPQKGATEEMCRRLDQALANYAAVITRDLGIDVAGIPGAGAAGGLGAGLLAFLGATIVPGIDIISEAVGLPGHLAKADLVFTGEGRLDEQTLFGKTVAGVAARAKSAGVPVIVIAGEVLHDLAELHRHGVAAALSIAPGPVSLEELQQAAAELIAAAAEEAMRLLLTGATLRRTS